jgi:hypothetical protein
VKTPGSLYRSNSGVGRASTSLGGLVNAQERSSPAAPQDKKDRVELGLGITKGNYY